MHLNQVALCVFLPSRKTGPIFHTLLSFLSIGNHGLMYHHHSASFWHTIVKVRKSAVTIEKGWHNRYPQIRSARPQGLNPKGPSTQVLTWHGFSITSSVKPVLSSTGFSVTIQDARFCGIFARLILCTSMCKVKPFPAKVWGMPLPQSMNLNCPRSASWSMYHAECMEKCLTPQCSLRVISRTV